MSVLICSACLDKIVSNLVKESCIILNSECSCVLCVVIDGVSILFLVPWACVIFGPPSVSCRAARLSSSSPEVFVMRILAGGRDEENLVRMIA
jgi:hypothetical protein